MVIATTPLFIKLKQQVKDINWPLLVFLLLFLNVKLVVKIVGLIFIYAVQPNFKTGFRLKNSRLPLFYLGIIAAALFDWLFFGYFSNARYNLVFITGITFWLLCILAAHQVKLLVEKTSIEILRKTIGTFFLINALISFADILFIIFKIHRINPYTYQGHFQEYFLNTGDYIKGATFDVAITNSVISGFGVIYFLIRQNYKMLLLCMAALLLSASNTINIMLFGIVGLIFLLMSNRVQKSMTVVCLVMAVVFMAKISPQNRYYVAKMYNKILYDKNISFDPLPVKRIRITDIPNDQLSPQQKKEKIAQLYLDSINTSSHPHVAAISPVQVANIVPLPIAIPKDSIHTATFQSRSDTDATQRKLVSFIALHKSQLPLASETIPSRIVGGKILAVKQTVTFLKTHPSKDLTGDGIGNFSSKLAFKATALGVAGGYPAKMAYVGPDFMHNHLDVYLNFFSRRVGMHSVLNSPDSVYNQLLGEYGLVGLLLFAVFYLWFFLKRYKSMTYGVPLLLFACGVFSTDYWFEQLSIIVLLELLLFTDISSHSALKTQTA